MERRKRRNDEEARNGSRKKGIVPSFSGRKNRGSWEGRTKRGRTRKGWDEERSGNRKKRGMAAGSIPLHALDASIFFANNVRVNYPHRYQSDEGGSRLRRCCLVWRKRDQPLSRASQKIEFTKIPSRSRRLLPRHPANVTRTIPAFPVHLFRSEIPRCFNPYSLVSKFLLKGIHCWSTKFVIKSRDIEKDPTDLETMSRDMVRIDNRVYD